MVASRVTPFVLGNYRCAQFLGHGHIGAAYLAVHLPTDVGSVVKILHAELLKDHDVTDVVLQSFKIVQALGHPNIVGVREIFEHAGELCIASEHVAGLNLTKTFERLRHRGPMPPVLAARIAIQIAEALGYAHNFTRNGVPRPLVHGALWPENVLISRRGGVFISDFGAWAARAAMDWASLPARDAFICPEVRVGDRPSKASDVFAMGLLLYELLTAERLQIAKRRATADLLRDADVEASLERTPLPLCAVLRQCLRRDPSDRFADAAAFHAALVAAIPAAVEPRASTALAALIVELADGSDAGVHADGQRAARGTPNIASRSFMDGLKGKGPPKPRTERAGLIRPHDKSTLDPLARLETELDEPLLPPAMPAEPGRAAHVLSSDEASGLAGPANAIMMADETTLTNGSAPRAHENAGTGSQQDRADGGRPKRLPTGSIPRLFTSDVPQSGDGESAIPSPAGVPASMAPPDGDRKSGGTHQDAELAQSNGMLHERDTLDLGRGGWRKLWQQVASAWSPAHTLLAFSIIVFLLALGLMIRRHMVGLARAPERRAVPVEAPSPSRDGAIYDGQVVRTFDSNSDQLPDAQAARAEAGEADASSVSQAGEHNQLPRGQLTLSSDPPALAYVGGKRLGVTPVTVRVRPGRKVFVALVASGREMYRARLRMPRRTGKSIDATLPTARYARYTGRNHGVLRVKCRGRDERRIIIDGHDTGYSCPKVAFVLQTGVHRVALIDPHDGDVTVSRARVRRGKATILRPKPWSPIKRRHRRSGRRSR